MKKSVTLVELIFVLVIIGILSFVGLYTFRPNFLRNDANLVFMKLETTRYQAIGYNKNLDDLGDINYSVGCIKIDDLNKSKEDYKFRSTIEVDPASLDILCFDRYGRLHDGSIDNNKTTLNSLLNNYVIIKVKQNEKNITLKLFSKSGYIKIID